MSLAKPTWLERRELKEEDSGPEGGVVTWLGDFVGQSRELSLSAVGQGRDRVFPSVVGATRFPGHLLLTRVPSRLLPAQPGLAWGI